MVWEMTRQRKQTIIVALSYLLSLIFMMSIGHFIVEEISDDDSRIYVINEKRPGVTTWTTTEGKKTIHHDAGAIWIKATLETAPHQVCTWAERNPFHADAYKIGERYDFQSTGQCTFDPSPNGAMAVGILVLYLFSAIIWLLVFEDYLE